MIHNVNIPRGTTDPWVDTIIEVILFLEILAKRWRHVYNFKPAKKNGFLWEKILKRWVIKLDTQNG